MLCRPLISACSASLCACAPKQVRSRLPPGVDGWGYSLKGMMGMVVVGGLLITGTYWLLQRTVVPTCARHLLAPFVVRVLAQEEPAKVRAQVISQRVLACMHAARAGNVALSAQSQLRSKKRSMTHCAPCLDYMILLINMRAPLPCLEPALSMVGPWSSRMLYQRAGVYVSVKEARLVARGIVLSGWCHVGALHG